MNGVDEQRARSGLSRRIGDSRALRSLAVGAPTLRPVAGRSRALRAYAGRARAFALCAALVCLLCAGFADVAAAAPGEFGVASFFAANCKVETCKAVPAEEALEKAQAEDYVQAAGHPAYGVTDFTVKSAEVGGMLIPEGVTTHARIDVAPGVVTNPEAVAQCPMSQFGEKEVLPLSGLFTASSCEEDTEIGVNEVLVYIEGLGDLPLSGKVYNLVQPPGLASDFGVALELPTFLTGALLAQTFAELGHPFGEPREAELESTQYYAHTLVEGSVEWAGNYHDYFEIEISPTLPLVSSRLIFDGDIGNTGDGAFLTNPSSCAGPGPQTTSSVTLQSARGETAHTTYTTPVGIEGCNGAAPFSPVPFAPELALSPETTGSDRPDGIAVQLSVPHDPSPTGIDSSQVKDVTITLPEGMTLNPSAAHGLLACTPAQIGIGTRDAIACPVASQIGNVSLNVPMLPPEALQGHLYLGGVEPITHPPYTVYLDASSARYGVSVRLKGTASPDPATGKLTVSFPDNPEQPFSDLVVKMNGGARAPLANSLGCGAAATAASLTPYTGTAAAALSSAFGVSGCATPLPFALTQSAPPVAPAQAGAHTSYTFSLQRADGQQYLAKVQATLPPGLVGAIASVPLCEAARAASGACPAASAIGTATASVGAGSEPYALPGAVYLTGPYDGAPYGLSIVTPAIAGPFNLGLVITRATIDVDPHTAQVTVTASLPTIVGGIPLRLKGLSVTVDRTGFLQNPTSCKALSTRSTLTSTLGASQSLSSPYQVSGCGALAFKPAFAARVKGKHTRRGGAYLHVTIRSKAGQANIAKVRTTLPIKLPARLSTLKLACEQAQFAADPAGCPQGAFVGKATVRTPILSAPLSGKAIYVSHGGRAFPDLDLVLHGDGVTIILVGNTHISKKGITTTTFKSLPDVPVSRFDLTLPQGSHSALAGEGNLCYRTKTMMRRVKAYRKGHVLRRKGHVVFKLKKVRRQVRRTMLMPTVMTAASGATLKRKTKIAVTGCAPAKRKAKQHATGKGKHGAPGKANPRGKQPGAKQKTPVAKKAR